MSESPDTVPENEEAAENRHEQFPKDAFDDSPVDRRTFLQLSAATAGALSLPGAAAASDHGVSHAALTDRCEFVVNNTPDDYEAAVIIEFADGVPDGFGEAYTDPDWDIDDREAPPTAVTREAPTPAAHAHFTTEELTAVLDEFGNSIEEVDFSPGANPWWQLDGAYADGVFPAVEDARGFMSFEEAVNGVKYLESEVNPDRINVTSIGQSPGWENAFTGENPDRKDIYVAEVTNNVDDEASFAEKDKAVYSLSIHGDERSGIESGCRLIEDIAYGEASAFEDLLDDIVLLFLFTNPDGWVSRNPETVIPWVDHNRNFQRGSASGVDTNRQYPTMGWIDPSYYPAEPEGAPEEFHEVVPDSLAIVEHFRTYDNVEFLCDYHGMYVDDHMVFNLETNAPFDHGRTHELDEVSIQIGEGMQNEWGSVDNDPIGDDILTATEAEYNFPYVPNGDSYNGLLDWGTIYDSLNYQVTGAFLGWAGQPEEFGGLGAVTVAPEIIISNDFTSAIQEWKPYWARHYVTAYRISMREYARMTAAETDATVASGGQDTAYVSSETLTRTSADLSHTDESPGRGNGPGQNRATEVQRRHETVQPGPGTSASTGVNSSDSGHSLFVHFEGLDDATEGTVQLKNPAGNVVREIDLDEKADPSASDSRRHDFEAWFVRRPEAGNWSVDVEADTDVDVQLTLLESDSEHPDPEEVLGYEQREYVVNPMQFFKDLDPYVEDGDVDAVRVHDVRNGRLLRGRSGQRHYDKLVVSHDDGRDDSSYIEAIEAFVEAGGDLVLTDSGVNLLAELDVGDAAEIDDGAIQTIDVQFANLANRVFDHDLLAGIRPRQQEIWKGSQLGYTTDVDQPATIVDVDTFENAGGEVAGTISGGVGAGRLQAGDAEINVVGSVLPPAQQTELHPFGMGDYAVSFMGHTLLCNALGFEQRRYFEGELIRTYGEVR
ncbi:peptidase M14 [Natronomonas halophila]|uniref:M14 family metallopeptidase n=1 Tax=Natronomonas halophila TaxID=2747817 RepID=UPI0015B73310|nr:M14 family metallopeptidase [Natronomonas halophila]QLD84177.1 peptidase M14 [Natronomonas halophila]